jgi:hypothetical protein
MTIECKERWGAAGVADTCLQDTKKGISLSGCLYIDPVSNKCQHMPFACCQTINTGKKYYYL